MSAQEFTFKARHGNSRTYKLGCRCPLCREAQRVTVKAERANRRRDHIAALIIASDSVALASLSRDIHQKVGRELERIAVQLRVKAERMAKK